MYNFLFYPFCYLQYSNKSTIKTKISVLTYTGLLTNFTLKKKCVQISPLKKNTLKIKIVNVMLQKSSCSSNNGNFIFILFFNLNFGKT